MLTACAASPDSGDAGGGGTPTAGDAAGGAAGTGAGAGGAPAAGAGGTAGSAGAAGSSGAAPGAGAGGMAGAGPTPSAGAGAGGTGGDAGGAAPDAGAGACSDDCPKVGGVDWLCKLRFMYGYNYAWHHFANDIGGNTTWNQPGVSDNPMVESELGTLADAGVSVVRFWVWPDFRGDGVSFDAQDRPVGLAGTALADLERLLQIADELDLYLMLTIFSFDNFQPTRDESGIHIPGLAPIARDDAQRAALMANVVRPFARAAASSAYAERLIAWDVINEPEWAMTGPSLYGGDEDFDPDPDLESLDHASMERFVADVIEVLRDESDALISVGGAAIKWRSAWSNVDVDFHHFHIYDWVDQYWPYDMSPADYGLDDKPVVMGEFPAGGLARADYLTLLTSFYDTGYGGALAWSLRDYQGSLAPVRSFAEMHACETRY